MEMEELVKSVAKKTGITEENAREAVKNVVAFLKEKMPEPLRAQIDAIAEGKTPDFSGIAEKLGAVVEGKKPELAGIFKR